MFFQNRNKIASKTTTILENTYGCAEQYICVIALYLRSMLANANNITIECRVGSPGHFREFVYCLNAIEKRFLTMLMTTV